MNLDEGLINPHNQIAKSSLLIIYGSKYDLIHIQGFQSKPVATGLLPSN